MSRSMTCSRSPACTACLELTSPALKSLAKGLRWTESDLGCIATRVSRDAVRSQCCSLQLGRVYKVPKLVVEVEGSRAGCGLSVLATSDTEVMSDNRYYVKYKIASVRIGLGYTDHRQM